MLKHQYIHQSIHIYIHNCLKLPLIKTALNKASDNGMWWVGKSRVALLDNNKNDGDEMVEGLIIPCRVT